MENVQVEDYRAGYPRFSALIAACGSFQICRRFTNLRVRVLLAKQDQLSILEKQLERIDREETSPLFLGSSRSDRNQERSSVIARIDAALADYDALIQRNRQISSIETAQPRDITSLLNWVNGNACLARDETAYLGHCKDLLYVAPPPNDSAIGGIETWVEDKLTSIQRHYYKGWLSDISRDPNVYIFSATVVKRTARILVSCLIVSFLVGPSIICIALEDMNVRTVVVVLSTIAFVIIMTGLIKAKSVEILVAGASYATVLIVFVSGTNVARRGS